MVQKCLLKVENQFTDDENNFGGYPGSPNLGLKNHINGALRDRIHGALRDAIISMLYWFQLMSSSFKRNLPKYRPFRT